MFNDHYTYPAIFSYDEDGISVEFPDLPGCYTCANDSNTAISMTKESLALHLSGMEDDNDSIPTPSDITSITLEENQVIVLVDVWMPIFRDKIKYSSVKKTLTIPKWLNDVAEENHINFSQLLQSSIKEQLGISNTKG
jgi:predicted RNase H-like HicB family nuclease